MRRAAPSPHAATFLSVTRLSSSPSRVSLFHCQLLRHCQLSPGCSPTTTFLPAARNLFISRTNKNVLTSTCSSPCSSQTLSPAAIGTGWHLGGFLRQHWQHGSHSNSGDPDRSNEPNASKVVRKGSLRLHSLNGKREEENPVEARRHRPVHVAS